ncbi:MAG: TraR/DksA family transcriptional regulator [Lentisphaerae bacterium]|jgi:DnaK suppressor protein|nr:TraR/DksA family transcriptional regulator [Lentisphaerota bacterium]
MAKSNGNGKKIPRYTGIRKKYYDSLMKAREQLTSRMNIRREDALNTENLDKRGVPTHMADSGNNEMELHLLTEDGNVLEMIDLALERLANGEYGNCQDCDDQISEARLEYRPYALYCTKCKSIREQNNGRNPNVG